ncbi:myoneurin-like [Cimex lectularius]|uniref:C2H2-type domain-containing protein n=1 Tax=Cimex lectularius TaxID=79782 RepID=A0A8I6SPJ2_CIMLE|nr:myoneurin-like [Cimex lectularius]
MLRSEYAGFSTSTLAMLADDCLVQDLESTDLFDVSSTDSSLRSASFMDSGVQETKEPNNNHLPLQICNYGNEWQSVEGTFFGEINYWRQNAIPETKSAAENSVYPYSVFGAEDPSTWQRQETQESSSYTNNTAGDLDDLMNVVPSNFSKNFVAHVENAESPNFLEMNNATTHAADAMTLHEEISYPQNTQGFVDLTTDIAEPQEEYCPNGSYSFGSRVSPVAVPAPVDPIFTLITKPTKKYTKRSKNGASTSGTRRERSLHYCHICSKGFKDKYSVNVHIRTHTGEKPFHCSYCAKCFRQKAHLAKHYQTHLNRTKSN